MRNITRLVVITGWLALWVGCTAETTVVEETDFGFDGTCVNCHAGLSAGHVHTNYKLRCIDCHGGNDQVNVPDNAAQNDSLDSGAGGYRDDVLIKQAHVNPDPKLARFFYANGIDDDGDGFIDEPTDFDNAGQTITDLGEIFEPGLHGEGPGEFMDAELNRDLNYTRFLNPGDLRVATIGCGSGNRGAFDGGGGGACHQETIDIVRRGMMVNNAAVTNGAYYGNESFDAVFAMQRDGASNGNVKAQDPRFGAFAYALDYDGDPNCIKPPPDPKDPRSQPFFDRTCLQARASSEDPAVAANAQGNVGLPAFEIAQGTIKNPLFGTNSTQVQNGAGDSRWEGWGSGDEDTPYISDAHAELAPLQNRDLIPPGVLGALAPVGIPDPVDNILRTFRAYYPLNYPASTTNFNFTFGTSILPDIGRFRTADPYGRGHSSGCTACHSPYDYSGSRSPTRVRQDDGTFVDVVDPTTKHREFDPANDEGPVDVNGTIENRLIGRPVGRDEVFNSFGVAQKTFDLDGNGTKDGEQERTYSKNHTTTTKIDTDTCGLCHGFVTRINYAYQGAAEEEQRDVLSRKKAIEFTTPKGTKVAILDSWVREDNDINNDGVKDATPTIVRPAGLDIIEKAKKRDADLLKVGCEPGQEFPACGLAAGAGGCAQATFTEDCNNNGELDTSLTLERRDLDGNVIGTITINEDLNGNGKLDLIDRIPREKSIDGRQVRYVYGGRNGSTRQMDVHFERGMHCIDCHFLQDVHGDGNVYSTNWDAIEIECEDCHGASKKTNFKTSGPNGGNDMRIAKNEDLEPFFEDRGGQVIQRSRVNTGVFWIVPQTADANTDPYAKEAHDPTYHVAEPGKGSEFVGEQGQSELTVAKVECATCHNGWIHNCLGCHVDIDVGDKQRNKIVNTGGVLSVEKSAGENEIWMSNAHNNGHINFQLLGLMRAPFIMGVSSSSEQGRLGLFRSSMQVMASVTDATGDTLRENLTFTTFQTLDANSGRINAATSGVTMNQTMAHTVRPDEARGCELCHSLVDNQGRTRNEHIIAQSYGIGDGSILFTGDWMIGAGLNGIELFDYKQERELANQIVVGASQRFPGLIVNPTVADRKAANVEPLINGQTANDVVLIRNFNPTPAQVGGQAGPSLRDFAVTAVDNGGANGQLIIADISARGHRVAAARPAAGTDNATLVAVTGVPRSLAHMASDVSDPFVYAAVGAQGISVTQIFNAASLGGAVTAMQVGVTPLNGNQTANEVALAGDFLYVGTTEGNVQVYEIDKTNPKNLTFKGSGNVGAQVNDIAIAGFVLYVATPSGLAILTLDDPFNPVRPTGGPQFVAGTANATGVAISEGHAFVACGAAGIIEVDARTVADPKNKGNISNQLGNVSDVVVSVMPGQKWVLGLENTGDLVGVKLDGRLARAERCFPDPGAADCLLEMEMYDAPRSGRDPSFDPNTGAFDPLDPSGNPFFRMAGNILGTGRRLARPVQWEAIGTLTGRRYRDSFMPGSGVISLPVMQQMRAVQVCETNDDSTNPAGLKQLGYFQNGQCKSFQDAVMQKPRHAPICRPGMFGPGLQRLACPSPDVKTAGKPAPPAPPARSIDPGNRAARVTPRR